LHEDITAVHSERPLLGDMPVMEATYCMGQSPYWDANICWASQHGPCIS